MTLQTLRPWALAGLIATWASTALAQPTPLDRLAWLAGCWRSEAADPLVAENWLAPAGGSMVGMTRTVRQRANVAQAFMQIREIAGGGLVFVNQANGKGEAVYTLVQATDAAVSFENEGLDFPQRVSYRLDEAGRLHVRLQGPPSAAGSEAVLARASCDAQPPGPEAFQGLHWGAGEAQIALRFGSPLARADCKAAASRTALRPREACDHPLLPRYEVAGVPFRLALHVDERARQLVRVSLLYTAEPEQAEGGWGDKHRVLRQLLTQRYGGPESTHVDSDGGAQQALARWRRGDTLIELSSTYQPRAGNNPARERVEIVYQPVTAGEAGKL
jgi:hypothetical protein